MKQEVGKAAAVRVQSNCGAGYGVNDLQFSFLSDRLKSGEIKDIIGVPSFRQKYWLSSTASL